MTPLIPNLENRSVVSFTHRPDYPEKRPPVHTEQEVVRVAYGVWTLWRRQNSLDPERNRNSSSVVRPVT